MSRTELVVFKQNGEAAPHSSIQNAWRGAMAIWKILEAKYLDAYKPNYVPSHIPTEKVEEYLGCRPSRLNGGSEDAIKDIWNLYGNEAVSITDKIVLGSTFDRVLVKKEDLQEVIQAFQAFEGETSLTEQAEFLKAILSDEAFIAVGWNQTSITQNQWTCARYDEENDVYLPYNCLTGTQHFWLFDDINKMRY